MTTFETVKKLIVNQLNLEEDKVTENSDIINDLGADSLDIFEMLMTMDEEFGITLPDEKVKDMRTVGDLVKFIDEIK